MRYLLDTHTLAWAVGNASLLSKRVRLVLSDPKNELWVSPVTIWEMSIQYAAGKWPEVAPFLDDKQYDQFTQRLGTQELFVRVPHTRLAGQFKLTHKDPFDRLLAAQAVLEGMTLVSKDAIFDQFPSNRLW